MTVRALSIAAVVCLAGALYRTVRIAAADACFRGNTLQSLERAAALDPSNARIRGWLAEHRDYNGLDASADLRAATALNPLDSASWIRLALRTENQGDLQGAEALLRRAAAVDRLFEPRWALANFYFRRNDAAGFERWLSSSLEMAYGDLRNVYRLAWRMRPDAAFVLGCLPKEPRPRAWMYAQFLEFLAEEGHAAAEPEAARALAPLASPAELPVLVAYTGRRRDVDVWNTLCRRRLLPYEPLTEARPVTNSDFRLPLLNAGFDWRILPAEGVTISRRAGGLRIVLDGRQPEQCDLLAQTLPPGREKDRVAAAGALPPGFAWNRSADGIVLGYRRPSGMVRFAGEVLLREVRLEPAE